MIGAILITLAFVAALSSMVGYGLSINDPEGKYLKLARIGFHTMVICVMFAAAILMYLILTHQFQYTYVWSHSSKNLSTPFLFAAFYSGQEGSFMLWTLLTALIGVFVLGYAQQVRYEAPAMGTYMLVMALLLLILVVQSPFETIYASFPDQNLPANFIPEDGKGLNPQLENLWITIHPPMLFTGFAAMTVPFVFAIAAMIKRDYQRWISIALPWTLFASMILGFGIMLGGWWAYETLGWGGYWAWDPVENSSLIPWLVCVALVHTMLVQKRTGSVSKRGEVKVGGLVKTNLFLAIMAFGLILYSTFLTRSGILGDTSVHSFVEPGNFVFIVLVAINVIFIGLGLGMLILRLKDLRQDMLELRLFSRETALAIGSAVLLASAFIVLIGTSWPLIVSLFNNPKIAIEQGFYNSLHIPIAFALVVINAMSMRLKWKNTPRNEFMRHMGIAVAISLAGTLGVVLLGVYDPIYMALSFGSILALVVNLQTGIKIMRGNPRFTGAYIAHAGVAILVLGVVASAGYSRTEHVRLVQNEPGKAFGYTVTFEGVEQIELEKVDREKYQYTVVLEKDGERYPTEPIIFWSDFNRRESAFLEPGILYTPTKDVYVSPKAIETEGGDPRITMHKGDKAPIPFDSSMTIRFEKFDMSRAASSQQQGAVFEISTADTSFYLTAYRYLDGRYAPESIPGTDISVGFGALNADPENLSNSEAVFTFKSASNPSPEAQRVLVVDVSIKPFISFVWGGVIIMVVGFFVSILRRRKELDLFIPRDIPPYQNGSGTLSSPKSQNGNSGHQPMDQELTTVARSTK